MKCQHDAAGATVEASPAATGETAPTLKVGPASRVQVVLVLAFQACMALAALAVPVLLLVRSRGQPMSQVWILAVTVCTYVFVFLLHIWRSWRFTTDLIRLSCGLLLAQYAASHIGTGTTVVILHLTTAWAAAYLGYSIALHRLHNGTERAIVNGALPSPCCYCIDAYIIFTIPIDAAISMALWTALTAAIISLVDLVDELVIFAALSSMGLGWIHVAMWVVFVAHVTMHGVHLKGPTRWLVGGLVPCLIFSPAVIFRSRDLSVLLNWLPMMVLLTFLGYNLAVHVRYLQTAEAEPATPMRSFSSLGSSTLAELVPEETSASEGAR